jgi:hypothetical protein
MRMKPRNKPKVRLISKAEKIQRRKAKEVEAIVNKAMKRLERYEVRDDKLYPKG